MFATRVRTLAATAAAAVLSLGIAATVHADEPATDSPCATQEAKVAKAKGAHARVNAAFAGKKDKAAQAQAAVAAATSDKELAKAEKRLAKAQEKATKVKKEKKAQLQRLAKAEARLAECVAAQTA